MFSILFLARFFWKYPKGELKDLRKMTQGEMSLNTPVLQKLTY